MTLDQAQQRAERNFKREERAQDGRKAMIEYEAQAVATRKKTAHLESVATSSGSPGADRRTDAEATQTGAPLAATNNCSFNLGLSRNAYT